MSPDDSETTSTEDARGAWSSASCAAAGSKTSACWRRWPRCRASASCPRTSAAAPTGTGRCASARARRSRSRGSWPAWPQLLELRGDERVLEVGAGSGYAAAVLSRLCREVVTIERHAGLRASGAQRARASSATTTSRCGSGDGTRGAPDRAPFGGISVTASARERAAARAVRAAPPGAALVCPVERGGRELLMRLPRRRGGGDRARPLRAAGERAE